MRTPPNKKMTTYTGGPRTQQMQGVGWIHVMGGCSEGVREGGWGRRCRKVSESNIKSNLEWDLWFPEQPLIHIQICDTLNRSEKKKRIANKMNTVSPDNCQHFNFACNSSSKLKAASHGGREGQRRDGEGAGTGSPTLKTGVKKYQSHSRRWRVFHLTWLCHHSPALPLLS